MPSPSCTLLLWVVLGGLHPLLSGGAVPRSRAAGAGLVDCQWLVTTLVNNMVSCPGLGVCSTG
jgi:hypothetical protein